MATSNYTAISTTLTDVTIGIARATVKIGLAKITYNTRRAVWLVAQRATTA